MKKIYTIILIFILTACSKENIYPLSKKEKVTLIRELPIDSIVGNAFTVKKGRLVFTAYFDKYNSNCSTGRYLYYYSGSGLKTPVEAGMYFIEDGKIMVKDTLSGKSSFEEKWVINCYYEGYYNGEIAEYLQLDNLVMKRRQK